jgi:hypothetical protein
MFQTSEDAFYLMCVLASVVRGGNKFQEFYILLGTGANGKTLINTLLRLAFGKYWKDIEPKAVTAKELKPNATSDWPKTKGARVVTMNEPDSGDYLQGEIIKRISGRDPMTVRNLNNNPITFIPLFTALMSCNGIPSLRKVDDAIRRRFRLVRFPFQFKLPHDLDPNNPLHRPRDNNLIDLFEKPEYYQEFMLWMIDFYHEHVECKVELVPTESHRLATEGYIEDQNPMDRFLEGTFEVTHHRTTRFPPCACSWPTTAQASARSTVAISRRRWRTGVLGTFTRATAPSSRASRIVTTVGWLLVLSPLHAAVTRGTAARLSTEAERRVLDRVSPVEPVACYSDSVPLFVTEQAWCKQIIIVGSPGYAAFLVRATASLLLSCCLKENRLAVTQDGPQRKREK